MLAADADKAHFGKFWAARSPKPFISVLTISIGAYCFRWNLSSSPLEGAPHPKTMNYAPLVLTVCSTSTIVGEALHLGKPVNTIGVVAASSAGVVDS